MAHESKYFSLSLESLRSIGSWAADCAERVLWIYEMIAPSDSQPRTVIEGVWVFARGGKRTTQFRSLVLAALAAVCEVGHPAAARAAGLAAASAYMHSLADVRHTKHILGPVVYAALALELEQAGDPGIGDAEVRRGIEFVSPEVCEVLR